MQNDSEEAGVATENGEIVEVGNSQQDAAVEQLPAVHPQIDPRLSLPEHLQSIPFDEDVWRRMAGSKFRHPKQTDKALREDAEMRDILRAAMAAASEREKEVLMHNQARVFSSLMHALAKSVGNFLSTPLAPNTWVKPPTEDMGEKSTSKPGTVKSLILFLLTPKVFLTAVALGFGVLAGYSQIQVYNLNATIESYQSALTSLNADKDALNGRLDGFDGLLGDRDREVGELKSELVGIERENAKLTTEASGLNARIDELTQELGTLKNELSGVRAGREASTQELQAALDQERANLAASREQAARLETELTQTGEALSALEAAKDKITEDNNALRIANVDLKTDLVRMETAQVDQRNQLRLLTFSERALNNIRVLADRYSSINAKHVLEHIDRYEDLKLRHNSI